MGKSSFAARIKQKAKEAEFSGGSDTLKMKDGISFFKPQKGKNEMIILPFTMGEGKNLEGIAPGEPWFRFQILKHYRVGPEDKSVICPRTINKRCPICEHRAALIAQGKPTDDPEVKELTAKKRELYYIIDLADDDKLKIFECSYHNFGKKLEEEIREADDDSIITNFADPDEGAVVSVRMAEATLGKNKFYEASRFDFEKRDAAENKLVAKALKEITPFGELIVVQSYKDLKTLFYDLDEAEATDEMDEEEIQTAPAKRSRIQEDEEEEKPARRRQVKQEEPDEDEEEETPPPARKRVAKPAEEEPEEEDEAPRPKRKSPAKPVEADEDEEDAEPAKPKRKSEPVEDEPDEEPAPKRASSKKAADPECPGDGNYGQNCDELDDCEDCPYWSGCRDLTDDYIAAKKAKKK